LIENVPKSGKFITSPLLSSMSMSLKDYLFQALMYPCCWWKISLLMHMA